MKFTNKVVIITGGGTGIGMETARAFLAHGANVVLNGRRESKLQEAITELDPTGKHAAYLAEDIGKPEIARQLIRTAVQRFGGVDILVNNAGIFKPTPFLDHTEEDYNAYLNVILGGTFYTSQAAIPEMQKRGGGAIVNGINVGQPGNRRHPIQRLLRCQGGRPCPDQESGYRIRGRSHPCERRGTGGRGNPSLQHLPE